jgi:RNA polymerase sigma-70 factor (ECF subfamily)
MGPARGITATPTSIEHVSSDATFEELFAREHLPLFRALYLVTGNTQEAEELMQDAFLKVWERWDRVGGMDKPAAYLYRVAINLARSRFRRTRMSVGRTLSLRQPEDPFAAVDLRDAVVRGLATLTERQRLALVLTELLDLGADEAGALLHVKASTVRSLASQGRAALSTTLEKDDA